MAISNHRLLSLDEGQIRFRWKVYRHHDRPKTMTLDAAEFLRRFLLHVLPAGFHRIRHSGFLSNRHRARQLARCRALLAMPPVLPPPTAPRDYRDVYEALTGVSLRACPVCQRRQIVWIAPLAPGTRAPPEEGPDGLAPYHPVVSTTRWALARRPDRLSRAPRAPPSGRPLEALLQGSRTAVARGSPHAPPDTGTRSRCDRAARPVSPPSPSVNPHTAAPAPRFCPKDL